MRKVAEFDAMVVKIEMGLHLPHYVSLQGMEGERETEISQSRMVSPLDLHCAPFASREFTIGRKVKITIEVDDDD